MKLFGVLSIIVEALAMPPKVKQRSALRPRSSVLYSSPQHGVLRFHLGDAHLLKHCLLNPRIAFEYFRIFVDVKVRGNETVAITGDANEVRSTLVDFFEARADDLAESDVFIGQSPAQIHLGEADAALSTE